MNRLGKNVAKVQNGGTRWLKSASSGTPMPKVVPPKGVISQSEKIRPSSSKKASSKNK
ncbi:hypothetical protein SAMN04515695_1496 [Pseudovibrio sp. Tun.PSC04-5.I4]|nr:hypothetical protein SAMN04515695_1496 [Pseudovibrio sp. Tun.PSC04-5.I4]